MSYSDDRAKKIKEIGNCIICGNELTTEMSHAHMGVCSRECFTADFWNEKIRWKERNRQDVVRVEHVHYIIGDETPSYAGSRGHGGSKFIIKFLDTGNIVESTNLWYQGGIPEHLWDTLPDNAVFIKDYKKQGFIQK